MPFGKMHSRNPDIIKYSKLINRTSSALAMKLTNLASLDPSIRATGRSGLTGASNTDKMMWTEMKEDWGSFVLEISRAEQTFNIFTDETDSVEVYTPPQIELDYTGKNRLTTLNVRIGQNFFRKSVLSAYNMKCCISGLTVPQLLIASHIVPWSIDNKNRLNPRNGLCLSMIHDKAFDLGIITVNDNLSVKVAESYLKDTFILDQFFVAAIIEYDGKSICPPDKFYPDQELLYYHRSQIFKGKI